MVSLVLLFFSPVISLALYFIWRNASNLLTHWRHNKLEEHTGFTVEDKDPYLYIQALRDFDWRTARPIRNAPLKPKYHLTMALENISLSELIEMDSTYLERMGIRRQLLEQHPEATIQSNPMCEPAALELYEWLVRIYLPGRFPSIYNHTPIGLLNTATNETLPYHQNNAKSALKVLGSHIDTDFLLLLPSSKAEDGSPIYHLEAFVTCFPSGFSTYEKLGLPLAQIHSPVPGYQAKLEKSMDRFFAKLECGRIVKRANWMLTTNEKLFSEGGSHLYESGKTQMNVSEVSAVQVGDETVNVDAEIQKQKAEVVPEDCRLRSERQTLFRLPKTRALVFSFKTYQYRLDDVKKDGYAEELAEAMEGLAKGNVPEMDFYKRGVVWREKVIEYLRS